MMSKGTRILNKKVLTDFKKAGGSQIDCIFFVYLLRDYLAFGKRSRQFLHVRILDTVKYNRDLILYRFPHDAR